MLFDCFPQRGPPYFHAKVFSDISDMGLPSISSETRASEGGIKKKIAVLFSMNGWSCFSLMGSSCLCGEDSAGFALEGSK